MEAPVSLETLKSLYTYHPASGMFTRNTKHPRYGIDEIAGGKSGNGYWLVSIGNKQYRAHILAWYYMTGEWFSQGIDHANRNKLDNRWSNLRKTTKKLNAANCDLPANNTSGYKGVSWSKQANKWHAYIKVDQKRINLGFFNDIEEAARTYDKAALKHFGAYAATNEMLGLLPASEEQEDMDLHTTIISAMSALELSDKLLAKPIDIDASDAFMESIFNG